MNRLHCDKVQVLEWYDGIVQGIIRSSEVYYYAALLAWDVDSKKRLFLILPIAEDQKNTITEAFDEPGKWPAVRMILQDSVERGHGFASRNVPLDGADIDLFSANQAVREDVPKEQFIIDSATSEAAMLKWL